MARALGTTAGPPPASIEESRAWPHARWASSRWGTWTWQGQGSSSWSPSLLDSWAIKGKLSHRPQDGHTQRPMGPRQGGVTGRLVYHAAQASLCRDDASRPQGNHRPQRTCVSIQTCKSGSAATSCKQRGPDRPVHRTPGSLPASPGWLPATPHPTWPSPGRLGPRSRAEALPQPMTVTSAGKEKHPQRTGLPRPTVGLAPGLPSLDLVWLSTQPFSEPEAL